MSALKEVPHEYANPRKCCVRGEKDAEYLSSSLISPFLHCQTMQYKAHVACAGNGNPFEEWDPAPNSVPVCHFYVLVHFSRVKQANTKTQDQSTWRSVVYQTILLSCC